MEPLKLTDWRRRQRDPRRHAAAGWCPGLAVLWLAGMAPPCLAAESMSGLGAAFRPQAVAAARVVGSGQQSNSNAPGLRVIVSGASGAVASIDGRTVHVGDIVNDMRVTQINLQGVVLTSEDGTEERLTISPSAVKRMRPVNAKRVTNGAGQ
jgi:hypothetical protein